MSHPTSNELVTSIPTSEPSNPVAINDPTNSTAVNDPAVNECRTCILRRTLPVLSESLSKTIWQLAPFVYTSDEAAWEAISVVAANCTPSFYLATNEEGYTYTQWQIYYLGKTRHDCRALYPCVARLFRVLSKFPFFLEMIRQGSAYDPLHNTLHHFARYIERIGWRQHEMVEFLVRCGLSLDDPDSEGMTPREYLSQKCIHPMDLYQANFLTRSYKEYERALFAKLPDLKMCHSCGDTIDPYTTIEKMATSQPGTISPYMEEIGKIYAFRRDCTQIYEAYFSKSAPTIQRHVYVLDLYQRVMDTIVKKIESDSFQNK